MFRAEAHAGTIKLSERVALGWVVSFVTITCLAIVVPSLHATRLPREQYDRALWVGHTRDVMEQLTRLALHVSESESDQRGFLLSGDPDSLTAFDAAVRRTVDNLGQVQKLVADNESQTQKLSRLRPLILTYQDALQAAIERRKGDAAANPMFVPQEPKAGMTLIQETIDDMWKEEQTLLQARISDWQHALWHTQLVVFGASLISFILMILAGAWLWSLALKQRKLADTARQMGEIQRIKAERLLQIVAVQDEIAGHALDLDVAMQIITEHTGRLTEADGSIVETVDGDEMVYRAASGLAAGRVGMRLQVAGSLSGMCVRGGAVLRCDDSETDDRVDRVACRKVGLRSMIVVPLRHQDQRLGVLKVLSTRVSAFTEDDVATLELLAGVLSGALSDATAAETLRQLNDELVAANSNLEKLATTDGMTGLKNHRTFQETLAEEFPRTRRNQLPLSLLLLDVDYFKKFNDTFGHPAGDDVLKRVATIIQQNTRAADQVARYGGEEFVVLLPETNTQDALNIAERIRGAIENEDWPLRRVTISLGISTLTSYWESAGELIAAADEALYQSKRNGRNRVTHYDAIGESADVPYTVQEAHRS